MPEITIDFEGTYEACKQVHDRAKSAEIPVSEVSKSGSIAEPLNAPLTPSDILLVAHLVTATFAAGTSAIVFLNNCGIYYNLNTN